MGEGPWVAMAAEPERRSTSSATWGAHLQRLARLLGERAPGSRRSAGLAKVDRGRLSLLLDVGQAPFHLILVAGLQPGLPPGLPPLRWGIAARSLDRANARDGKAMTAAAIDVLDAAVRQRQPIAVASGDHGTDALLGDLAPGFAALLAGLTERQREVGRLLLVEGLRRSEVATALGISRPTVSVMVDRARLLEIERFARALDGVLEAAVKSREEGV